jgi:hypothetical protein
MVTLHETQLESAIISQLQMFLLELGKGLAFVAWQKRMCFDDAQSGQYRIIRNKSNLFKFLNCDGVLWKNNNAEQAIKRFAHYREIADGHLTENGLTDYLVLLSVNQTCEYKDISF